MSQMKGPAIFLAQFADDHKPFDNLANTSQWAGDLGYKGIQVPTWEAGLIDLETAADSKDYCDEITGVCADAGVEITELSTHLQGQLVAVHPAYDELFDGFAPESVKGNPKARQEWAVLEWECCLKHPEDGAREGAPFANGSTALAICRFL
jgi:sugar phosphate isomerase/epimerase